MDDRQQHSQLRNWLVSILVWYLIFMIMYLFSHFVLQVEWRFLGLIDNAAPYLFFPAIIGLLISLLLRALRLVGVYLLITLIGALWIGTALIPPLFPSSVEGTELDIITFNIFPDNPMVDEALTWIIAQNPDIVALQEIPEDDDIALAALNEHYPYAASQGVRETQALFSRYPILEVGEIALEPSVHQRIVLDINGTEVAFYNVHLHVPLNEREEDWLPLRYDETVRNQQIDDLVATIELEPLPLIIAGDFNMSEWADAYQDINAELHDAYRVASWGIGATWPASETSRIGAAYPRLVRLDYIWYSEPMVANTAVVGANLGSDHLPLLVELIVP